MCAYVRVYHGTCWLEQGGLWHIHGCRHSGQATSVSFGGCSEAGEGAASPEYRPSAERAPAARRPRSVHARSLPQGLLMTCHPVLALRSALCLIVGWQPGRRMLVTSGMLKKYSASENRCQ